MGIAEQQNEKDAKRTTNRSRCGLHYLVHPNVSAPSIAATGEEAKGYTKQLVARRHIVLKRHDHVPASGLELLPPENLESTRM